MRTSLSRFFLRPLFISLLCKVSLQSNATTYNNFGTATNYNLMTGDTLNILSGTYTGDLYAFFVGAVIQVSPGATFKPNSISNPRGKLINLGTTIISFAFYTNYDFHLDNYGTMQVLGGDANNASVYMYGNQTWVNYAGGILEIKHEMIMGKGSTGSTLLNEGKLKVGALSANSGTTFINRNLFFSSSTLNMNGSELVNEGALETKEAIYMSGTSTNTCRMIAPGGFWSNNTASFFHNQGLLWVPLNPVLLVAKQTISESVVLSLPLPDL